MNDAPQLLFASAAVAAMRDANPDRRKNLLNEIVKVLTPATLAADEAAKDDPDAGSSTFAGRTYRWRRLPSSDAVMVYRPLTIEEASRQGANQSRPSVMILHVVPFEKLAQMVLGEKSLV